MAETAVIILNWNNQKFLEQFLPVLVNYTPSALADLIIADNGSSDGSIAWLHSHYPDIRIIQLDKNYGFAGGYNRAITHCDHQNLVILNSDIEVTAGWLEPLLSRLKPDKTAAVMPKMRSWHLREHFEYAGACGGYLDRFGYPYCRGRIFDQIEQDNGQYDQAVQVHWATGACMVVKKDIFLQAGGFDDEFFAHMEEIDLCWRMRRLGFDLWVEPKSIVFHVGGGTLPNESPGKLYLNFRNNLALLYKNLPRKQLWSTLFIRMILDGVAALHYLASGKFRFIGVILKAHYDFYRWKPRLKAIRESGEIPESSKGMLAPFSLVWKHFVQRKNHFTEL